MPKQFFRTCAKCGKGTNNSVYIPDQADRNRDKYSLCSKHYRQWLDLKKHYWQLAVEEFWKPEGGKE
ncbi:MAG: hypothetical protein MRECE_9c009 [Mycoplasmataceae bacterium CE_OT135]|nr:MAG: hypothetical protein MRECE_9c009 [Mycoplasmataceae bacterium CE_OT135]